VKVNRIRIPKTKLLEMPKAEQALFVQATQLMNELLILHKLLLFVGNKKHDNTVLVKAQTSYMVFLIRIQTGLLWEAWRWLEKKYLCGPARQYNSRLSPKASSALARLKVFFNKPENPIKKIRDRFAFHYCIPETSDAILRELSEADDEADFEIYYSDAYGNCLYPISDFLVTSAMIAQLPEAKIDSKRALKEFFDTTHAVREDFLDFLPSVLEIMFDRYFGYDSEVVPIPDPPKMDKVELPFFTKRPDRSLMGKR